MAGTVCAKLAAVSLGVVLAAAAGARADVVFSDDFEGDAAGTAPLAWSSSSGNWQVVSESGGNQYLRSAAKTDGGGQDLTHVFGEPVAGNWAAEFAFDWKWGGKVDGGYGQTYHRVTMQMLDGSGNGYAVLARQGNSNDPANDGSAIEIYTVSGGVVAEEALASGEGYNAPGWAGLGLTGPRFFPVRLTWDVGSGTLQAFYDDGSGMVLSASATDTSYSSFDRGSFVSSRWNWGEEPQLDSIVISSEVPEPASLVLAGVGAMAMLSRRKRK